MNNRKLLDLERGKQGELMAEDLFKYIYELSNCKLVKNESKFAIFDFEDSNSDIVVEVKCRNNNYNSYPTSMVGKNKIDWAFNNCKTPYFIFIFNDGSYYWKYNIEQYIVNKGGRKDRGKFESSDYAYIDIKHLIKIEQGVPPLNPQIISI